MGKIKHDRNLASWSMLIVGLSCLLPALYCNSVHTWS